MGGGGARRRANEAADASREEAGRLQQAQVKFDNEAIEQRKRAGSVLARARRARGGGFFESDSPSVLGSRGQAL